MQSRAPIIPIIATEMQCFRNGSSTIYWAKVLFQQPNLIYMRPVYSTKCAHCAGAPYLCAVTICHCPSFCFLRRQGDIIGFPIVVM